MFGDSNDGETPKISFTGFANRLKLKALFVCKLVRLTKGYNLSTETKHTPLPLPLNAAREAVEKRMEAFEHDKYAIERFSGLRNDTNRLY
jgi:hypothetical protein